MVQPVIQQISVHAYTIPTDQPESDGTLEWNSTTIVLATITAGGKTGIGYTYGDAVIAQYIHRKLRPLLEGKNAFDIPGIIKVLQAHIRNDGHTGLAQMALSAVDSALWDLKARILEISLSTLLGIHTEKIRIYGSGGFTSYDMDTLQEQFSNWASQGIQQVKMKIGREPEKDMDRIKAARAAIGREVELFVDANGAYTVQQALEMAERMAGSYVTWFEEPVTSDNLSGLHFIRNHAPQGMQIAAGEYGYKQDDFQALIEEEAIDVLQADATRCGGISGFIQAGRLSEAGHIPFSFHCAPSLHVHAAACLPAYYTGEYFHDHARIEHLLFDGAAEPVDGHLIPDSSRPGLGLDFRYADARKYELA